MSHCKMKKKTISPWVVTLSWQPYRSQGGNVPGNHLVEMPEKGNCPGMNILSRGKISKLMTIIVLYYKPFISKVLGNGPCVTRGSHILTCHPHMNHIGLYSPTASCRPPFGWYSLCLPMKGWPGWVDLGGWSHTEINVPHRELDPDTVTHPSTNWTRRRVTSLMCATQLPLNQAAT